jgi:hypothetical protein
MGLLTDLIEKIATDIQPSVEIFKRVRDKTSGVTRKEDARVEPEPEVIHSSPEVEVLAKCETCDGSGKVGKAGHEVECPVCRRK